MIDENRPRVVHPDGMRSARYPDEEAAQARAGRYFTPGDVHPSAGDPRRQPESASGLSPERVAEIRLNIRQGTYETAEVLEAVARRIVASGDLRVGS